MYTTSKNMLLILIAIAVITGSCNIRDNLDDCGIYLEFIFDYNMDYTDLFGAEIDRVDVYVFDEEGYYLFSRHADRATGLIAGKRMELKEGFSPGNYKIITVGALSQYFRFTDLNDRQLIPGVSTVEDVKLSLYHETNSVDEDFPNLWFGKMMEIEFKADLSVWPVYLVKETNHFNITVQSTGSNVQQRVASDPLYTFNLVTPESGAYDYNNNPLIRETVMYLPFYLAREEEPEETLTAQLNTMRLFADDPDGYQLVIRDIATSGKVWEYDLMVLLRNTKPTRPDGTSLPLQEYLDRQAEWNIIILYTGGDGSGDEFIAWRIIINGWIIWERGIEI